MILQTRDNLVDFKIPPYFLEDKNRDEFILGLEKIFGSVEKINTIEPDREYNGKVIVGGQRWGASDFLYLINHSHESDEFLAGKLKRSSMAIKLSRNRIYDINAWASKKNKKNALITVELIKEYLEDIK
ncbi:hypothetical protein HON71_05685 [Candidatus Woesearchaeota archaeon]|jgi:hypothetical protein|nr:hypothetical protein [Candidatus Woesearchaeota archaeon]